MPSNTVSKAERNASLRKLGLIRKSSQFFRATESDTSLRFAWGVKGPE